MNPQSEAAISFLALVESPYWQQRISSIAILGVGLGWDCLGENWNKRHQERFSKAHCCNQIL